MGEIPTFLHYIDGDPAVAVTSMPEVNVTVNLGEEPLRVMLAEDEDEDTGIASEDLYYWLPDPQDPLQLVALAMDKANQMPLYVEIANPDRRDRWNANIPSDAPDAIYFQSTAAATTPMIIDTQGYQSIIIHSLTAGIITPTTSNNLDSVAADWLGMTGVSVTSPSALSATVASAGVWSFPITGRYVKITGPATYVQAMIYLRQIPFNAALVMVTAGVAGTQAVGGNVATGSVPTTYPVQIAGVDAGQVVGSDLGPSKTAAVTPKVRSLLTDTLGRLINSEVDTKLGLFNGNSLASHVLESATYEGQTQIEILGQILLELRTLNFQFQAERSGGGIDDVEAIRRELLMYNYSS